MSDNRIDNLLDQLFAEPAAGNAAGSASERALRSLEADIGIEGGPARPPRAPRPSEPLLGATALDAQPTPRPAARPGLSPSGPMPAVAPPPTRPGAPTPRAGLAAAPTSDAPPRPGAPGTPARGIPLMPMLAPPAPSPGAAGAPGLTGSSPGRAPSGPLGIGSGGPAGGPGHRNTGALPRVVVETRVEPTGDMPPLGEAQRPMRGPPPPMAPRRQTGSMPIVDAARAVTGAMPAVAATAASPAASAPRSPSGPLRGAERRGPAIAAPPADDPLGFAHDPFALDEDTVSFLGLDDLEIGGGEAAATANSLLGSMDRVARLLVPLNAVPWNGLDPRAGFLLTQVDGCTTFDELVIISGLPEVEALALLEHLAGLGVLG